MDNSTSCHRTEFNETLIERGKQILKSNKKKIASESKIFSLLGNEVRLKIVFLILKYERLCVCDFSDILGMNQSPVSQHLRKLKDAGILENHREGLTIFYFIPNHMKKKLELLIEI